MIYRDRDFGYFLGMIPYISLGLARMNEPASEEGARRLPARPTNRAGEWGRAINSIIFYMSESEQLSNYDWI